MSFNIDLSVWLPLAPVDSNSLESAAIVSRLKLPAAGCIKPVADLPAAAAAAVLGELAKDRCVLAVLADEASARNLHSQLTAQQQPGHLIAGWEMLPYDIASPPRSAVSARSAALACLRAGRAGVYPVSAASLMLPCAPPNGNAAAGETFFEVGQRVEMAVLQAQFLAAGCIAVERVRGPGEFAAYGGQIDVYPAGSRAPCRLVLDEDRIEQIRTFDPVSQRSRKRIERFDLLAARDYPLDDEAIGAFRRGWREHIPPGCQERIYEQISAGCEAEGVEFLLPLFFGDRYSAIDYLRPSDVIWQGKGVGAALAEFAALVEERYDEARQIGRAALPPARVFADRTHFEQAAASRPFFQHDQDGDDCGYERLPDVAIKASRRHPYAQLASWLENFSGRVVFAMPDPIRRSQLVDALAGLGRKVIDIDLPAAATGDGIYICPRPLVGGFVDRNSALALVTESELYGWHTDGAAAAASAAAALEEFGELAAGDLVVVAEHGVGRFLGLTTLVDGNRSQEFIAIEYAKQAKLYVAVANCHEVTRYRQQDPDEQVKLDSLGGARWKRVRRRAFTAARDSAVALLEIYSRRAKAGGRPPIAIDERAYAQFCAGFPHPDTACQMRISAEVLADLQARLPMDRLLCGDVGFGKTEIALRAAWAAWHAGRQVVLLAPTTLLAEQHMRTFAGRFAGLGTRLLLVAGSVSAAGRAEALEKLASGKPAIAIGTHALLASKVSIPQLGLAIIDEENRFGVRHKERVKQLRSRVDVLAMSATPIPRSLSMALEGLRDLSLMATPPAGRSAVRTFLADDEDRIVREALARELARAGQVFYLHHRVDTIAAAAERVRALAPGARVAVVHAQLAGERMEAIMRDFYAGRVDVLVCSIVIGSGIDVGNANTILVPHAERYGLAQLHQLRGRVGRAGRQAYAYFLASLVSLKPPARQRLDTIVETAQLGGGHLIAMRDLEIRGAGELLGEAQSGAVADVGIEAFRNMVQRASRLARGEAIPEATVVDLGGGACLPQLYCPSPVERLRIYSRFAGATSIAQIEQLRELLLDRFGRLPAAARLLVRAHRLRIEAGQLGIASIRPAADGMKVMFAAQPPAEQLIELARTSSDIRLRPDNSVLVCCSADAPDAAAAACSQFIEQLTNCRARPAASAAA